MWSVVDVRHSAGKWGWICLSAKGRQQMRRAIHISWAVRILLRGFCMVERESTETVDTMEESGNVLIKLGGRFCVSTGGVTL